MNEFSQYIATETRKPRLSALKVDSYNALTQATSRRESLESQLTAAIESEKQYRNELQLIVNRVNELQASASLPVDEALAASERVVTLEKTAPDIDLTSDQTQTIGGLS